MKKQQRKRPGSMDGYVLAERAQDFDSILHECLGEVCEETGHVIHRLSEEMAGRLEAYSWPGDLGELRRVLRSAVVSSRNRELSARDLPDWFCKKTG